METAGHAVRKGNWQARFGDNPGAGTMSTTYLNGETVSQVSASQA